MSESSEEEVQEEVKYKQIAFSMSLKQSDIDLIPLFDKLSKGERSFFARQLMRDGLKWRLQQGIPLNEGSSAVLAQYTNADVAKIIAPNNLVVQTNTTSYEAPNPVQQSQTVTQPVVQPPSESEVVGLKTEGNNKPRTQEELNALMLRSQSNRAAMHGIDKKKEKAEDSTPSG